MRAAHSLLALGVLAGLAGLAPSSSAKAPVVAFESTPGRLRISVGDEPWGDYVYDDPVIVRPHFANLHAAGGVPVTRTQPPVAGRDLVDHPTFHPGLWLAFGDLNGADNWRLHAGIEHVEFAEAPHGKAGRGEFAALHRYFDGADPPVALCDELFRCQWVVLPEGTLLTWDSTFSSDHRVEFGDQEEMGLGLRVATPLRAQRQAEGDVPAGRGEIRDADGRRNEREVWGQSARWCDYSGVVDGRRAGMTLLCHPDNFRPSWFHARDRGLLVANPFGHAAFRQGEPSRVVLEPGQKLRLRFGILVYAAASEARPDLDAVYRRYLQLTQDE
ncbi:MAG TPA: PmoA family protein [Lacipirellulaceae bacterium]|nr:PmoA family protein [Lacipirellulaceae bacterium]